MAEFKFGNAVWGFRENTIEEKLKITHDMGLHIFELGIANADSDVPLDVTDEEIEEIKALYKKYDIEMLTAATGNDFTMGDDSDDEKVKKAIDICAKFGAKYIRVFAGFTPVAEVVGDKWNTMIRCINECGDYAASKGVVVTIETHGGVTAYDDGVEHFYSTSTEPKALMKMISQLSDSVKFNYDPANVWAVGIKKPNELYQKIKDRVATVHLKDFVTLPSGHLKPAACGESEMDWTEIMTGLKGFEGPMMYEYEIPDDIREGSIRCHEYMKKVIATI